MYLITSHDVEGVPEGSTAFSMHVVHNTAQFTRVTLFAVDLAKVMGAAQPRGSAPGGGIACSIPLERYTEFSERKMQKRLKKLR